MMRTTSDAHRRALENGDVKEKAKIVAKNKRKLEENKEEEGGTAAKRKAKDEKGAGLENQPNRASKETVFKEYQST